MRSPFNKFVRSIWGRAKSHTSTPLGDSISITDLTRAHESSEDISLTLPQLPDSSSIYLEDYAQPSTLPDNTQPLTQQLPTNQPIIQQAVETSNPEQLFSLEDLPHPPEDLCRC